MCASDRFLEETKTGAKFLPLNRSQRAFTIQKWFVKHIFMGFILNIFNLMSHPSEQDFGFMRIRLHPDYESLNTDL